MRFFSEHIGSPVTEASWSLLVAWSKEWLHHYWYRPFQITIWKVRISPEIIRDGICQTTHKWSHVIRRSLPILRRYFPSIKQKEKCIYGIYNLVNVKKHASYWTIYIICPSFTTFVSENIHFTAMKNSIFCLDSSEFVGIYSDCFDMKRSINRSCHRSLCQQFTIIKYETRKTYHKIIRHLQVGNHWCRHKSDLMLNKNSYLRPFYYDNDNIQDIQRYLDKW